MWELDNRTLDLAADRTFVRDVDGTEFWIVIVKGTFAIQPNGTTIRAEPLPVERGPVFFGEPGKSSLRYESDTALDKPGVDVIVHGTAHAPAGRRVETLEVGVGVGDRMKVLRAWGQRSWVRSGATVQLSRPEPFSTMPIRYENAFGGSVDPSRADLVESASRNPVGTGLVASPEQALHARVPSIEHRDTPITSWDSRPAPAGFGPIARDWLPRRARAGTYDAAWDATRRPLLPTDYSAWFQHFAPDDQVFERVRGGDVVSLHNLTPDGTMTFALPKVALMFRTFFGRHVEEHRARVQSVIVEPDDRRVTLVWGTSLNVAGRDAGLDRTVVMEKKYLR